MTTVSFVKTTRFADWDYHLGSTFTGTDRNGPNYHIGVDCAGHA